ncbi:hypothetical protein H5410_032230 [Solanum commersonii]|uniref:Uncharacterized protein n=1 Tax=Solanum commersonii TaxID=4109 RepID=A0A9J5YP25_SOLCO|nr:hypothetical protein H5410_032230 [Solanum commersonii]
MKQRHVDSLQLELFSINIFDTLKSTKVQEKMKMISEQITIDICADHHIWQKIIETYASNIGYGGILKQINPNDKNEY